MIKVLRSTLPFHLIRINCRLDNDHQHPHAVYDALAAFDWTVENILPKRTSKWTGKAERQGRIATCGELVGGSLATMLSLTECRTGEVGVIAAAINNPVLDWTDLTGHNFRGRKTKTKATRDDTTSPSLDVLQRARDQCFRKPENYYDAFASPMLFFKSAGYTPPSAPTSDDELEFHDYEETTTSVSSPAIQTAVETQPRTSRQFPSRALGLTLPAFYITAGSSSILAPQADELARQLRQSVLRQRKTRPSRRARWCEDDFYDHDPLYTSEDELAQAEAALLASQVQLNSYEGSGLWDDGPTGQAMIHSMANWFRERLVP